MPKPRTLVRLACLIAAAPTLAATPPPDDPAAAPLPAALEPGEWLVLPRVGDYRRTPLHVDPVEAAVARDGEIAPEAGDELGGAAWRSGEEHGADLVGGYAYARFESPAEGVMLLEAPGAAAVCLNGEWLPGDPYGRGWFRPPAPIRAGENWLLVHLARPDARPRFVRPDQPHTLLASEATLPDLVTGAANSDLVASIPLVNATREPLADATLAVRWVGAPPETTPLRYVDSLLVTPLTLKLPAAPDRPVAGEPRRLLVEVLGPGEAPEVLARAELVVRVVEPGDDQTHTFTSAIDGSVQPYSVRPATGAGARGLLVALHDAGQAPEACLDEYGPLEQADVVAPLGRGRYGFDWEDWSRVDALEALDAYVARRRTADRPVDEDRVALVGRGMGGHGALSIGTLAPDRFAAVGVIDGWVSFYTQGIAEPPPADAGPIRRLLARQSAADDPLKVIENLTGTGVAVLLTGHDRVSPSESRFLRDRLGDFHDDFAYREAAPGEDAATLRREHVAWLLDRRRRDPAPDAVAFATPDVGVLSERGWAAILGPRRPGDVARVRLRRDAEAGEITGQTQNVRRLRLDLAGWPPADEQREVGLRLDDGERLELRVGGREGDAIALARSDSGAWTRVPDVGGRSSRFGGLFKGPERAGGFKSAFSERPVLVYGTRGPEPQQAWAAAKARYDAHLFLYRGAGRLPVVPDAEFVRSGRENETDARAAELIDPSRSVVLYGSRPTNAAWSLLRQEAFLRRKRTVRVDDGRAWLGRRPESGDDLAVLAVRPRPGGRGSYLGVVGGTGLTGMRLTTRLRYFWSGLAYPDFLLLGPGALDPAEGATPADDVRAAGYYDSDWGVDSGGVLWRDLAI